MNLEALKEQLRRHEGVMESAYDDSEGFTTIGVGRLIDKRRGGKLSQDEIDLLLENDIKRVVADLDARLPWWQQLSEIRQLVLADLRFNLGMTGLLGFRRALQAMQDGRYGDAADEMLDSRWARQVGPRALRLAHMMRTDTVMPEEA